MFKDNVARPTALALGIVLVALILAASATSCAPAESPQKALSTQPPAETPKVLATQPQPTSIPSPTLTLEQAASEAVKEAKSICLEVRQSYPDIEEAFSQPIAQTIQLVLERLGLQVVDVGAACDATLAFDLTARPDGTSYFGAPASRCYTGAKVSGELALTPSRGAVLTLPVSGKKPLKQSMISKCPSKAEAPFATAWSRAVLDRLADL